MDRYIFYGSLKRIDLFEQITGVIPSNVRYGYIHGTLFEVTDKTDPWDINRYPIFIQEEGETVVIAVEVTVTGSPEELLKVRLVLRDFEGSLYTEVEIPFYAFNDTREIGTVFAGDPQAIAAAKNIIKLCPSSGVFNWRPSVD